MKMQRLFVVVLALGMMSALAAPGYAGTEAEVTYYKDVLPIMQENCQTCHRASGQNISGLVAPMSFMDFEETRPWARSIARKVESREMPPWFASAPHGVFSNERGLTDTEIATTRELGGRRCPCRRPRRCAAGTSLGRGGQRRAGRLAHPISS